MKKIIILGIICLFVGMVFQPAFAVKSRVSNDNTQVEEDCVLTFHIFSKKGERQKEVVLKENITIKIYRK